MPAHALSLAVGGFTVLAFVGLTMFIVHVTPVGARARVLTATASLMACVPAILFALYGR